MRDGHRGQRWDAAGGARGSALRQSPNPAMESISRADDAGTTTPWIPDASATVTGRSVSQGARGGTQCGTIRAQSTRSAASRPWS